MSYYIFDSRYHEDPERAVCLAVCDTLEEAIKEAPEHGDLNCIEHGERYIGFVANGEFKEV